VKTTAKKFLKEEVLRYFGTLGASMLFISMWVVFYITHYFIDNTNRIAEYIIFGIFVLILSFCILFYGICTSISLTNEDISSFINGITGVNFAYASLYLIVDSACDFGGYGAGNKMIPLGIMIVIGALVNSLYIYSATNNFYLIPKANKKFSKEKEKEISNA